MLIDYDDYNDVGNDVGDDVGNDSGLEEKTPFQRQRIKELREKDAELMAMLLGTRLL